MGGVGMATLDRVVREGCLEEVTEKQRESCERWLGWARGGAEGILV